jgi:hypothetical protein
MTERRYIKVEAMKMDTGKELSKCRYLIAKITRQYERGRTRLVDVDKASKKSQ